MNAGIYASAVPASCGKCDAPVLPGEVRPWLAVGRPLCGRCTVELGLGDVEGVVAALGRGQGLRAACRAPGDRIALARLQTAATTWAAARLSVVAAQLLDPDGEDR